MADGQDIFGSGNTHMPQSPIGMPLWQRILCLLDYHKWEIRYAPRRIRDDGMVLEPVRLRDQCVRCRTLANNNLKDPAREAKAKAFADTQPTRQAFFNRGDATVKFTGPPVTREMQQLFGNYAGNGLVIGIIQLSKGVRVTYQNGVTILFAPLVETTP